MFLQIIRFFIAIPIGICLTTGPAVANREKARAAYTATLNKPFDESAFKTYLDTLPTIEHPVLKGERLYLVEGDMPMTPTAIRREIMARASRPIPAGGPTPELTIGVEGGIPQFWSDRSQRRLKYAVVRSMFSSQDRYERAIIDMREAAQDWVAVCSGCGIEFAHLSELDSLADAEKALEKIHQDELTFAVIEYNAQGQFIAAAFFPNEPKERRFVLIDPSYYDQKGEPFTGRGVLRHELGHVLGYRHEHIQGIPGCSKEVDGGPWLPLTDYDGNSVMHYPCGPSAARGDLVLTEIDVSGHRLQYDPPTDVPTAFRPTRKQ